MASSHPTYNSKIKGATFKERLQNMVFIDPWSEEGIQEREDFASQHGRAWWIFQGITFRHNRKEVTWIEQYYVPIEKEDEDE
ncbi:hypothetical protein [uncultured Mediterranean phage uvMED]|jgi:hypothetical protein|nr:hypothetical protein [uncultured Mediterranean phage uvMED]